MNTDALIALSDNLVASATEDQRRLFHLINVHQYIQSWLHRHDLQPFAADVQPQSTNFRLVYSFRHEDLVPFVRIERSFWEFVRAYMDFENDAVNAFFYSDSPRSLASVDIRDESWELVLTPHPDVLIDDFPSYSFWASAAEAEETMRICALQGSGAFEVGSALAE